MKRIKQALRGGRKMIGWWLGDEDPVPKEQAEARATVCKQCPKNVHESFYQALTGFAADKMRAALQWKKKLKLEVTDEKKLQVCDPCGCILRVKVWSPVKIASAMPQEEFDNLVDFCWIRKEVNDAVKDNPP